MTDKSFDEAFRESQMSEEERAAMGAEDGEDATPPVPAGKKIEGAPDWAIIPADLTLPEGKEACFVRFRAAWTDYPSRGDRQCILWTLSDSDEKLAAKRARGDANRIIIELTKGCIRAIDGHRADWVRPGPASVERFWNEIGAKCRSMLTNYYFKNHSLSTEEQADFFTSCIAFKRVAAG
jgi:hypothetical protein